MKIKKFYQQQDVLKFLENTQNLHEHAQFEENIMSRRTEEHSFLLDGYCKVCDKPTTFLVDRLCGAQENEKSWIPNWRERLICAHCHLNNRQRSILQAIKTVVKTRTDTGKTVSLYVMEQITPVFIWLSNNIQNVTGSEYLGEHLKSGTIVDGIRHENIETLSFANQSFDIITSNDVLEHVNLPEKAIAEMYRILKPGGEVFISVPFYLNNIQIIQRATLVHGVIKHLLPPIYHGNPLSEKGSLVFNDFGWEFLEQLTAAGFQEVSLCYYWSYLYGHLGDLQYYFWARKNIT